MSGFFQEWFQRPLQDVVMKRLRTWWRSFDRPDPWSKEEDIAVRELEAAQVCKKCFTPQEHSARFCPNCGSAVGPYNNALPFVNIFSHGEALRSGVGPEAHFTGFRGFAYVMLGFVEYGFFVPLYLFRLYRNYRRQKNAGEGTEQEQDERRQVDHS